MIKHGFIRTYTGDWLSLRGIAYFSIKYINDSEVEILAASFDDEEGNSSMRISTHNTVEEAQGYLDKIFDYKEDDSFLV